METFDSELFLLENYRMLSSSDFAYIGNFFRCSRIKRITKSIFYKKSWTNSSSKTDPPPDFYNKKHKIMMEIMRVDDCADIADANHADNSFKKANTFLKKSFGKDYKKIHKASVYFIPDTSDSKKFNFLGYFNSFKRVVLNHSAKVNNYRNNHPECRDLIFFIFDESNHYVQVSEEEYLLKEKSDNPQFEKAIVHGWYNDESFIKIIKQSKADYVIWVGWHKTIFVNDKEIKQPKVCIYDVKNIKNYGIEYNHKLMLKVN